MTAAEWAGHLGFGLVAASYVVKDMFWLRLFGIAACVTFMIFNYAVPDRPLWSVIYWNVGFLIVNAWQLSHLLRERLRPLVPRTRGRFATS